MWHTIWGELTRMWRYGRRILSVFLQLSKKNNNSYRCQVVFFFCLIFFLFCRNDNVGKMQNCFLGKTLQQTGFFKRHLWLKKKTLKLISFRFPISNIFLLDPVPNIHPSSICFASTFTFKRAVVNQWQHQQHQTEETPPCCTLNGEYKFSFAPQLDYTQAEFTFGISGE